MAWAIIRALDNGLKHRLTGATLLVLLAVLLLPELFTGAGDMPRTAPPTAGSAEVPVRRYDIDLTERAQAPAPPAEVSPPAEVRAPEPEPVPVTPPTATPPVSAPPVAPQRAGGASGYFVQVGVFSARDGAERVAKALRGKGFEVAVSRYETGKRLYRVRVGPAADRAAAVALRERLRAAGQAGTVIAPN